MDAARELAQPCYSARLIQPFIEVLQESGRLPESARAWFVGLDPEARVHVAAINTMLDGALMLSGDPLLGLKASAKLTLGDAGVVDFVMSSAANLRASLMAAGRFMRLVNDALEFRLEIDGDRAMVRLDSNITVSGAAEDFGLCGMIRNQSATWPQGMLEDLDVWFRHAAPADSAPYQEALGPVRLHFAAERSGFGFARSFLEQPLCRSDRRLHALLLRYAESSLASLPQPESVTEKVRQLVVDRLASGDFGLEEAARQLGMSSRTLGRRLADEGTTFKALVDSLRKTVALRHVAGDELALADVALQTGFTETPSFYRAFRRWTNMTPSQYRRTHRGKQ